MTHVAAVSFSYADESTARRIERSVGPEVGDIDGDRTTAGVERTDAELAVTIEADDLVALRAGINTWLTLLGVAERAGERPPASDDGDGEAGAA